MFMYAIVVSIVQHIGAGVRFFFMQFVLRKKVVYKSLRYGNPKDMGLANIDNAFVNTFLGATVFCILIILMVKYLS